VEESSYDLVVEDRCSGSIPFLERPGGKKIKALIDEGIKFRLSVWQIDRLGRNLRDILNTIDYFNQSGLPIVFAAQGLRTLDENGKENSISKMMISILGVVSEMEREQIRERQREGISIAKIKGVYKGRSKGTKEDIIGFFGKEKNKKALDYLKSGYRLTDIAELTGLHINTISKIKKLWTQSSINKST
jgi:DNA invertase Pin-like site-specific DNA recombinase